MIPMIALVSTMVVCGADDDAKMKAEVKALQGIWIPVSAIDRGKPVSKEVLEEEKSEYEFKDRTMIMRTATETEKSEFVIDLSKTPKVISVDYGDPEQKGRKVEFIYEIKSDELKIAFRKNGNPRPESFEVKPKDQISIYVFKRKK